MPGGFVGVDVFFAISGYLITAHLLREVETTGALSLWGFWARRARRLLPAALLTLFVCAVGTLLFVPQVYWQQFLTEIGASTAYFQNWQLASDAVDYLAADNRASPVQHFWSLSAEEQFYLVWPLLIALGAWLSRTRVAIFVVLGLVTGAEPRVLDHRDGVQPGRRVLRHPDARLGVRRRRPARAARRARLAAARRRCAPRCRGPAWRRSSTRRSSTAPTRRSPARRRSCRSLGTLAVILAGMPRARWAPSPLLRFRPGQFLGDISYSVYLWHWPLLVFAPFVFVDPGLDRDARRRDRR